MSAFIRLAERTMTRRLPAIYQWPEIAEDDGLLAYGPRITQMYRQMARQLIKLMHGAKPADIPVEQSTVFTLVVNLKTAQAMGLDLPATFLARADEVIERDDVRSSRGLAGRRRGRWRRARSNLSGCGASAC